MAKATRATTFDRLIRIETDECVLWPHGTVNGYARGPVGGTDRYLHEIVALNRLGPRPTPKHEVCHTPGIGCQPHCINYRHLRWDTHAGNEADKVIDGTLLVGERCPWAKLTEDDVRAIRAIVGKTQSTIAADFGVTQSVISRIRNGSRRTWIHVTPLP